ncbi:MAG TPA: hypothetical protein P5092_15540 [Ruminococcus sp.]|nr:hypothetical protein [Ruminococcus sp.]
MLSQINHTMIIEYSGYYHTAYVCEWRFFMNMDRFKVVIAALIIAYIISPVDAMPGPIDDAVLALAGIGFIKDDD